VGAQRARWEYLFDQNWTQPKTIEIGTPIASGCAVTWGCVKIDIFHPFIYGVPKFLCFHVISSLRPNKFHLFETCNSPPRAQAFGPVQVGAQRDKLRHRAHWARGDGATELRAVTAHNCRASNGSDQRCADNREVYSICLPY